MAYKLCNLGLMTEAQRDEHVKQVRDIQQKQRLRGWTAVRAAVLARDEHRCRFCGSTSDLAVRHISRHATEYNAESNAVVLCNTCHRENRLAPPFCENCLPKSLAILTAATGSEMAALFCGQCGVGHFRLLDELRGELNGRDNHERFRLDSRRIGSMVSTFRESAGMTQEQFARTSGIDVAQVAQLEQGVGECWSLLQGLSRGMNLPGLEILLKGHLAPPFIVRLENGNVVTEHPARLHLPSGDTVELQFGADDHGNTQAETQCCDHASGLTSG